MMRKFFDWKVFTPFVLLLLVVTIVEAGTYVGSWRNWSGTATDRPREGQHSWYNYTSYVSWWTYYRWTTNRPDDNRRIELEFYDPANTNHCNRLEPSSLYEYGGDWIGDWWTDNQCGGWNTNVERLTFNVNRANIALNTNYSVNVRANILYHASYGGETNVSYTCFLCTDDWLGKLVYDAAYKGTSSTP
jgi:hypothetical protein